MYTITTIPITYVYLFYFSSYLFLLIINGQVKLEKFCLWLKKHNNKLLFINN